LQGSAAGQRPAITSGAASLPAAPGVPADAAVIAGEVVDAEIVDEWLDAARSAAATLATEEAGRRLWREAAAKANAGECLPADATRIQELITARLSDLGAAA
jgi:hypothetical protein